MIKLSQEFVWHESRPVYQPVAAWTGTVVFGSLRRSTAVRDQENFVEQQGGALMHGRSRYSEGIPTLPLVTLTHASLLYSKNRRIARDVRRLRGGENSRGLK